MTASPMHLLMLVEMAAPITPSSGSPKRPLIRTALPKMLIPFIIRAVVMISRR